MKKLVLIILMSTGLISSQAQWLRPETVEGAVWGGLIGGLVGADYCEGFSGEGAAIGAGIGLIAGSLIGESRARGYYDGDGDYYYDYGRPQISLGYGYGGCGSSAYVYYTPNRYCAPGYYYRPTRPNYVVNGTLLGATSGALIGSADGHAGEGAAIGAAAGLALGAINEYSARRSEDRETTVVVHTQPRATTSAASVTPPADLESQLARNAISTRPAPTSTYTWTARPQIADAPRVPDAPSF